MLLAGNLAVSAQTVTLDANKVSLKAAFEKIETASKYKIAYNSSLIDANRMITVEKTKGDALEIFELLLKESGCTYEKKGNYLIVKPQSTKRPVKKNIKRVTGQLLDEQGDQIPRGAIGLKDLKTIDEDGVISELKECQFMIACDVTNPLCGSNGCSVIYGPQKGATPSMIGDMDRWLSRYASICHDIKENADPQYPGTGAAGGMGYAFKTFTNATLKPGIDIVIEETRLEDYIQDADLVVTGEGMLDHQTAMGKAPIGVARLAKKYNKKVIAFAGAVKMDAEECNKNGIDAFFPIVRGITTLEEAMNPQNAKDNLTATAKQVMRLIMAYYC